MAKYKHTDVAAGQGLFLSVNLFRVKITTKPTFWVFLPPVLPFLQEFYSSVQQKHLKRGLLAGHLLLQMEKKVELFGKCLSIAGQLWSVPNNSV